MFVNLFLIIFVITGCCLDCRGKLLFNPVQNKGAVEANTKGKHHPIPNESIRNSIAMPNNVQQPETEMKQV